MMLKTRLKLCKRTFPLLINPMHTPWSSSGQTHGARHMVCHTPLRLAGKHTAMLGPLHPTMCPVSDRICIWKHLFAFLVIKRWLLHPAYRRQAPFLLGEP